MGDSHYKAEAKKLKAKGLQKLKWFCQMCEKQCRDENGFKCHLQSEGHQRQMQVFRQNPGRFMNEFSKEFKRGFVDILRTRHVNSTVLANTVYNEYIADKSHVHMNSTCWTTLSDFIRHLAEEGICSVEDTERGVMLRYRKADPEATMKQEQLRRREKEENSDEKRQMALIEQQIEAARAQEAAAAAGATASMPEAEAAAAVPTGPISFQLPSIAAAATAKSVSSLPAAAAVAQRGVKRAFSSLQQDDAAATAASSAVDGLTDVESSAKKSRSSSSSSSSSQPHQHRSSNLDLILEEERKRKDKESRKDYWLRKGIVVKIVNKELANGLYYKKKGHVIRVHDKYVGEIEMIDSGDIIRLDQSFLETVVPREGSKIMIVNGLNRGSTATLLSVDVDKFCAKVKIDGTGEVMDAVSYDDFSKVHSS